ncbi:putative Phosphofructokinase superfamily [Helianthus debilis subsp. tardiflorus]
MKFCILGHMNIYRCRSKETKIKVHGEGGRRGWIVCLVIFDTERKSFVILEATRLQNPTVGVGLVFYGRQSPGGHNVVWGLHEALKIHNPKKCSAWISR